MKKEKIQRVQNDYNLQRILGIEPKLKQIIEEAMNQRNVAGYNSIQTYYRLRNAASLLVGWRCENKELMNCLDYETVRKAIDDLLPQDDIDIGKPFRRDRKSKTSFSNTFSPSLRWKIMERDDYKCVKCGRTPADGIKLHVDHIFPKSKGGIATLENGQVLCNECNIGKGANIPLSQQPYI